LTRDPIIRNHPYLYAGSNPINYIDPRGLYRQGEIEEFVNMPLFSVPTLDQLGEILNHLGHEPWLRKAMEHELMRDLYEGVEEKLRTGAFVGQKDMPGFYRFVRDYAWKLIQDNGLCGPVDIELEATHLAIIVIAAIPAEEHNLPVRPKDLWALYPTFLPDGREEEPGWDKTGHFFNHAFLTFENLYMRDHGMSYQRSLGNAHAVMKTLNNLMFLTPLPILIPGAHPIEVLNAYYILFSGPLHVSDITLWDVAMDPNVSLEDWQVYDMARDFGLLYEWVSTVYPLRPDQDIDYWILQQGHELSRDIIMQGLADPGLFNDLAANKLGAKFGITSYHNPTAQPPQSWPE
jgi:hypothetical protein